MKSLLVSIICLAGAVVGGYFLYFDLILSGMSGSGKVLGRVEKHESTVRRKAASGYIWTNAQNNEELFRKDSIQTGSESAATVRLADGSLLDISENSLVVMDDTKTLAMNFLRGSVVVHGMSGDKRVSVGKDGRANVEELPVRLLKPESLSKFFVKEKETKEVLFSWETKGKEENEPVIFQISKDRKFSPTVTKNFPIVDRRNRIFKANLRSGNYFWRILSSTHAVLSADRQLTVVTALPLHPIYPENSKSILAQGAETPVQFRWLSSWASPQIEASVAQGDHRIEVSRDPQFRTLATNEMIHPSIGLVSLSGVQAGRNYWRIRSKYGDTQILSQIRSFDLVRGTSVSSPSQKLTPDLVNPSQLNSSVNSPEVLKAPQITSPEVQ